jgi:ornithine cyclodeaminase
VTSAEEPVLQAEWIPEGAHLNLVGSSKPDCAEVDTATVVRGSFYVDFRTSTLNQAGEFLKAMEEGQIEQSHIVGEIGQVLLGEVPGRQTNDEITIYKSLGVAAQDLIAADYIFREASRLGRGQVVTM